MEKARGTALTNLQWEMELHHPDTQSISSMDL